MLNLTNETKYNLIYVSVILIASAITYCIFIKKDNIKYEMVSDAYTQKLEKRVETLNSRLKVYNKKLNTKNEAIKESLIRFRKSVSKRILTLKGDNTLLKKRVLNLKSDNLSLNDELDKLFSELDEAYRKKDVLSDAVKILSVQSVELADHYARSHAKLIDTENFLKNCQENKK
jgi:chaperonin cofactor prefoldin